MNYTPNDLIDAYHELHRLADIIGAGPITELWARVRAEQSLDRPTGPIGTVTSIANDEAGLTVDIKLNKGNAEDIADTIVRQIRGNGGVVATQPVATADNGCPWCAADIRPRALWRHVNTNHRSDLEETYAEDGTKGLIATFGLGYQTAYGWAQRLEGTAA